MKVLDYILMSKGAAVNDTVVRTEDHDSFTYIIADENCNNLHVYSDECGDTWINCRDNRSTLNADPKLVARLMNKE